MRTTLFSFVDGPRDGDKLHVPSPAPAKVIVAENGAIIDVSRENNFPCYVKFVVEHGKEKLNYYEYEGAGPDRA